MDKKPFIMARTGFNKHDIARDACQLFGPQAHQGYDWWWHSFTGHDAETGEEKPYEFNFSKAWTRVHTEFECKETNTQIIWHVEQRSTSGRMITDVTCEKKDMLLVNYESPDGAKRHNRLWNGGNGVGTVQLFDRHGNLVDRIHAENIGCEYGEYDK